uniref:Uncharacterized protein n=1 Tax=viral metagenome TaxID=1070528 RepID=A0A6C0H2K7_9ZZZZ
METELITEHMFKKFGDDYDKKVERELKIFLGFLILKKYDDDEDVERERNIYDKFCEILQETKSVIYGNFILNAVSPINEPNGNPYVAGVLDIVATYSGAVAINDFIKTEMNHIFIGSDQDIVIFQPYKDSIERNNKIQSQIMYHKITDLPGLFINIVDDDPSRFVSRQHLSFLQILFDGEHVKATHIEDVKNKKGTLKREYLPLIGSEDPVDIFEDENYSENSIPLNIKDSIDEYRTLGFEINYDRDSKFVGHPYLYGTDVSEEEHFVSYLYYNLVNNLVNNVFRNMLNIGIHNEDITCADIYLRWFYLEKPTMKEFIKIIQKIIRKGTFLLPLWIQDTYKKEDDILVALLLDSCSLYIYFSNFRYYREKDPKSAQYFANVVIKDHIKPNSSDVKILKKRPKSESEIRTIKMITKKYFKDHPQIYALVILIKKIMIKKYLVLPESYKYDYEKDYDILNILLRYPNLFLHYFSDDKYSENESETFKEFALIFIQTIRFENEEDLLKANIARKTLMEMYNDKFSIDEINTKTFKNYETIATYEKYKSEKEDKEKSKPNTRNIPALNIVRPSRTKLVDYDEKNRMVGKKCINASTHSLYNINAFLKGKYVSNYTTDGKRNREYDLPPANPRDAMKRVIFFLATSDKLDDLTPFCYNLDLLTKDIGNQLYVECKDFNDMQGLNYLFGQNPVVKLDLEFAIYVPLSEILDAIYNTKKQVFVLVPTEKVLKYTASMAVQFGTIGSMVSGHHCQEGSYKQLHTIKVCKGSEENACWPVNEAIELNEVYPNSYFMKQKFYIWSKSEKSLGVQWSRANQKLIDRIRLAREYEMHRRRVARGESPDSQLEESPIEPPDDVRRELDFDEEEEEEYE